jgi:epsin
MQFTAPQPAPSQGSSFSGLLSSAPASSVVTPSVTSSLSPAPSSTFTPPVTHQPTTYQAAQPNYFTSVSVAQPQQQSRSSTPGTLSSSGIGSKGAKVQKSSAGGDAFSGLLAGSNLSRSSTPKQKGPTMADMAKQKASAGIWGTPSQPSSNLGNTSASKPSQGGSALDDLLG